MAKYVKKPVKIDAEQWDGTVEGFNALGENLDLKRDAINSFRYDDKHNIYINPEKRVFIETLEGVMEASPGDFIIKGVKGELYPCKPDIFKETYEYEGSE